MAYRLMLLRRGAMTSDIGALGFDVLSKPPKIDLAFAGAAECLLGLSVVILPHGIVRNEEG